MKKVGIIGSGAVAKSLAQGFLNTGSEVMLGTRDISKLEEWKDSAGKNAHAGSFSEAAKFGEVLVLAVAGYAAVEALNLAGIENLTGKVIIDTTNPISKDAPPEDGVLKYFTSPNSSLMEQLQGQFPEAHFVKAFNSVGNMFMVNPSFAGGQPTMFICGNSESARAEVKEICETFGWEVSDMGKAAAARAIEPLCQLWCIPGFLRNEWSHGFKLVK